MDCLEYLFLFALDKPVPMWGGGEVDGGRAFCHFD